MIRKIWISLVLLVVGSGTVLLSVQVLRGSLGPSTARAATSPESSPAAKERVPSDPNLSKVRKPWVSGGFQSGAMVLMYGNDPQLLPRTDALLDRLARLNVNSVGLVFPIFQKGHSATDIYVDPVRSPTTDTISLFIREAHRRGFAIMLRPLLDEGLLGGPQFWRGNIDPPVAAWFASYDAVVVTYAKLAQHEGAQFFDIGTEFVSLEAQTNEWLHVIADVRRVFHGRITYSVNSGTTFPDFGQALDFLGVDAYYPLDVPESGSVAELVSAWAKWVGPLQQLQRQMGRPLVVTELGLSPQSDVLIHPWLSLQNDSRVPLNLDLQRRYYAASCQALAGSVSGIYWWEFGVEPPTHPNTDFTFDPSGKPAEQEVGTCFSQQLRGR